MIIDEPSLSPNTSFVSPHSEPAYNSIPKIRVIVRKRPLNQKELAKNDKLLNKIKKEAPTSKSRGVLTYVKNISQNSNNV